MPTQLTLAEVLEMLVSVREQAAAATGNAQLAFVNFCLANITRSRSQLLQDLWVAYELRSRKNGFFVEFGAADGITYSNSLYLESELGWRGILAEPARIWHHALKTNRACFVDDRCVWIETGKQISFNEAPTSAHSTIDAYSNADMHAASREGGRRYMVETVSLNDLLVHWGAPRRIEYLSMDTEGSELEILSAFDFETYDVRLITVEHNHTDRRQAIFDLLKSKGYRRKFEALSNVDDWYVRTY